MHERDTDPSNSTAPSAIKIAATLVAALAVILALSSSLRSVLSRPFLSSTSAKSMTTVANAATNTTMQITKRPWNARGHADHGWLYTFHTFSFASYYDPSYESFGPLRVINEDRVQRGEGFGKHPHKEFLIWSYIVNGELEHKDSMGNTEKLRRGEVQFTQAGTGVAHSEYNRNEEEDVHFLQIWAIPETRGLTPSYKTKKFTDDMKKDKLLRIMESAKRHSGGKNENDPIPMHADLSMSASILSPGMSVTHELVAEGQRNVYLHVVMGGRKQPKTGGARVKIGDVEIGEGDGAFVKGLSGPGSLGVESVGDKDAEFLLFDMGN
ncbi:hypothetical protein MBLNU230_g5150t1 [Neophaeotheca triangularis]